MSQLFTSGGHSIGASASASNEYSRFVLLAVQGTLKSISSSALSLLYGPTLTSLQDCWKNLSFDYILLNFSTVFEADQLASRL